MDEMIARMFRDLAERPGGPLAFRFYLQPLAAIFFGVRDGLLDSRHAKPPYLLSIFTYPERRRELIRDGWQSIAKIVVLAIVLDLVYQAIVLKRFYPGESVIVASGLAILPYAVTRGLVNRLSRTRLSRRS